MRNGLRTSSGKFLRVGSCYPESFGFLRLEATHLQLVIKNVGKVDPKRHLEEKVDVLMTNNVVQCLGAMLDTIVFK